MDNSTNNQLLTNILITLVVSVLSGIIVAFIIGEGSLFADEPFNSRVEKWFSQRNARYEISIVNKLLKPVEIKINDEIIGTIDPMDTLQYVGNSDDNTISYMVVDRFGFDEGLDGYFFEPATDGETYTIDNVVGDEYFYYFRITNDSDLTCEIILDKGYETERSIGFLNPHAENISAGYFRYYSNSNFYLNCDDGKYYYWGNLKDHTIYTHLPDLIEKDTGLLQLRFSLDSVRYD